MFDLITIYNVRFNISWQGLPNNALNEGKNKVEEGEDCQDYREDDFADVVEVSCSQPLLPGHDVSVRVLDDLR